jgi:hypothetical protein
MIRAAAVLFLALAALPSGAATFGVIDIELGASEATLAKQLDFRDINQALAQAGRPDFGARGYGCLARGDDYADTSCVSHIEKLAGVDAREVRLTFIDGWLQQFSLTAEARHYETLTAYLRTRFGEPQAVPAAETQAMPRLQWQDAASRMIAYRGSDLVFVNFELASYAGTVQRRRERAPAALCR